MKLLPPQRLTLDAGLGGLGLRCYWCGEGCHAEDGIHAYQFADGIALLCYMCEARVLALCNGASPELVGIRYDPY